MNKNNLKNHIKYLMTKVEMGFFKLFWIFPIRKGTILFLSYDGKQYSDSPRILCDSIRIKYPTMRIIWALNDTEMMPKEVGKVIKRKSLEFFFNICTVETIISNNSISSYIPIRNKQIFLNTWHGGSPTKTVGYRESNPNPYYKYYFRLQEEKTTAIISSSDFFTKEVIGESFGFTKVEILKYGLPRNDILLSQHDDIVQKVYDYFGINRNESIVLYAPTFRGDARHSNFLKPEEMLSIDECIDCLEQKFGKKFVFLFRAHHTMNKSLMSGSISATDYPDMQELLCAADVLITDYSSCMHDFALMKKPVFLYIPDYLDYMNNRGFYWDIPTMPFPFADTLLGFKKIITEFDPICYTKKVEKYLNKLGNYEIGMSTERTVMWLAERWKKYSN